MLPAERGPVMFLEAQVKQEREEVTGWSAASQESTFQLDQVIKEEPAREREIAGLKAELCELYNDHVIKDEMVLGPERHHRPDVGLLVQEWAVGDADGCPQVVGARGGAQPALRECSVRLERLKAMNSETDQEKTLSTLTTHTDSESTAHTDDSESDIEEGIRGNEGGACNICGAIFSSRSVLKHHVMIHIYVATSFELDTNGENETHGNSNPSETGHVCDICKETFPLKSDLMEHVAVHIYLPGVDPEADTNNENQTNLSLKHDIATSNPEITSSPASIESEPQINTAAANTYICDMCDFSFKRKLYLIRHIKEHLNSKSEKKLNESNLPFSCHICNKKCKYLYNLRRHEQTHTNDKPYCCDICKKTFKQKIYVSRHILSRHTVRVARPRTDKYFCKICNKGFPLNSNLHTHMRTHTGVKPFSCEICKRKFSYSSVLKAHKRIHTGEKPYTCKVCSKKFRKVTDLYRHERIHSGTKPHACDICDKRFSQLTHLTEHMRVHSGEKPYSCRICKTQFTHSSSLSRHLKRTHGEETPN